MSLIIGINIPNSAKQKIKTQLKHIKQEYERYKWVDEEIYHIKIFTFQESISQEKIKEKLNSLLYDQEQFYLYTHCVSLSIRHKIKIFIEFIKEKKLEKLAEKIERQFDGSFQKLGKYIPHLDIGTYRIASKQQYLLFKKKLKNTDIEFSFLVGELVLFETSHEKGNNILKIIHTFSLYKPIT